MAAAAPKVTGIQRWPGYAEKTPRRRQLALYEEGYVYLEHSHCQVETWQDFKDWAFSLEVGPEIYCNAIVGQPWWEEALGDIEVQVIVPSSAMLRNWNMVQSIKVKKGRKVVWVISSGAWNFPTATPDFLDELETLFALCGVGERPTPGSLGQALMRCSWHDQSLGWVSRPTNAARAILVRESLGGRVDYWTTPKERYETIYESDVSGAYGSVCGYLPGGMQATLHSEPKPGAVSTWFMRCKVHILADAPCPVGIFGERGPAGTNVYPTQPGWYEVWIWKEEADLCRANGWTVIPQSGYGWTNWNRGLEQWAQLMYCLRRTAEKSSSTLGMWLKSAMVASLGRFGMPMWSWQVLPESSPLAARGDLALMDGRRETGYILHRTSEWTSNALSHWYSYILMRCRLVLRQRMVFEMERGNTVLASNYDAIYCVLPTDPVHLGKGLGQWKQTKLTKVRFPFPRGIQSQEKTTLPGVKRTPTAEASGGVMRNFRTASWSATVSA